MDQTALKNNAPGTADFFSGILDGLLMGGIFIDHSRVIRHCNPAAEKLFGYSRGELVGKTTDVIYGDRRLDKSDKNEIKNRLTDYGYHVGEAKGIRKDGRQVLLNLYTFIVKEGAGAAILIRESEKVKAGIDAASLLQDLMDTIPDMVYFKDRDNRFTMVNKAHAEAVGLTPDQLTGKSDLDLFPKDIAEKYFADDTRIVRTGKGVVDKIEAARRPDGGMTYVSTTKIPRFDRDGKVTGIIGITRDVTGRVTAEEKLKSYKDRLEEMVRDRTKELEDEREKLLSMYNLKSDFVSTVSHELRTPLTVIRGNVDVVADGTAGPVTEKQRALLDAAIKNVDRLTRLITDILDLSKLETRRMHYRIVEGSINDVLSHVAKSCEAVAAKKGIYIRTALDPFLPLVCLDRDRAAQVMYNLVSNAMKFTRAGGITISSAKDDSGAKVTVEDTGCGIMKDDMQRIFEKFEQVDRPEEGKPEGTGLGLAISKQIVEQLGGRIWAESEYGKGSKFMFTLPFKERLIRDETE